jgi:type II secretory pathway pseudopilin PulG
MVAHLVTGNSQQQTGFAYLAVLVILTVIAITLASASTRNAMTAKREREKQLFFVGEQFYNAFESYYNSAQQETDRYPKTLQQLLVDNRSLKAAYHLRQFYVDPMTQQADWGLIFNENKQIVGVYSLSAEHILKTNLSADYVTVSSVNRELVYSDLKFVYLPQKNNKASSTLNVNIDSGVGQN